MLMLRRTIPVLVLLVAAAGLPAAYLTQIVPQGYLTLQAVSGGKFLVRQRTSVDLAAGLNEITFLLPAEGVTPPQVRLRPLSRDLALQASEWPQDNPKWIRWQLQAPQAGPQRLLLTYPAGGLSWEMSYLLKLAADRATWEAWVRLTNQSSKDWATVRIGGLSGAPLEVPLPAGTDVRVPLFAVAGLPCQVECRYDPDRYGPAPMWVACVPREPGGEPDEFARAALPPGRVEILRQASTVPALPDYTLDLKYTPRYCDLELPAGVINGLSVNRRLLSSRQVNVQTDVADRVALYDLEEEYEITVTNQRVEPVTLQVFETIPDTWEILKSSLPYAPEEAHRISFQVTVPAQQEARLTYLVRRMNLEP